MKNNNSHTLMELEYRYKDSQSQIFLTIFSIGFIIPIICAMYLATISLIFRYNAIFTLAFASLSFLFIYIGYISFFKIKIKCRLTDKGIIFENKMFHHKLKWNEINSYEIKNDFVLLNTKGIKYIGIGFPIKNHKDKTINILNFYITKK